MSGSGSDNVSEEVRLGLAKILSRHGHGFHYAIMRRAEELQLAHKSRWVLEATEFPVTVQDQVAHIDFVLRAEPGNTYLVAECKRIDPARARWCFMRAPYTWRESRGNELVFEEIVYQPGNNREARAHVAHTERGSYHVGIELKTGEKGEGAISRSAIDSAATQLLRGANGLIDHFFGGLFREFLSPGRARFLPVIFTTAELWVSSIDLGRSDLKTGKVSLENVSKADWVWFTHNQSSALRHSVARRGVGADLSMDLQRENARTMAIVSPDGLESFLTSDLPSWLD